GTASDDNSSRQSTVAPLTPLSVLALPPAFSGVGRPSLNHHLNQPQKEAHGRYECPPSPSLSSSSSEDLSESNNGAASASSSEASGSEGGEEDDEDSSSQTECEDERTHQLSKLTRWGLSPPVWSKDSQWSQVATFNEFTAILAQLQDILTEQLQKDNYNTFGNLLHFYNEFRASGVPNVESFYRNYEAPIVSNGLSCVGLSFRIRDAIVERLPTLRRAVVLASCEEWVEELDEYVEQPDPGIDTVKEHVMLAVRILCQETNQKALVILDSGYHVPKTIVVTSDGLEPHTGRFVQSDTQKSRKEYEFRWKNDNYIQWVISETRKGHTSTWNNLIYTGGNYGSSQGYSEKRNLIYDFRTVVARDAGGPCAGVYVKFNEPNWSASYTLFYKDLNGHRIEAKVPVHSVLQGAHIQCAGEIAKRLRISDDKFLILLEDMARMYEDRPFIRDLLFLNYAVDPFDQAKPLID
ncbi:uncharacterized protein LOC100907523, partial [Galendromus occidentalis]|uniref:Uncharacterized protein LOC100907523 n=1 Tax=Galendromus occidentalis TaxID=34638 RepID=A0AAJ7L4D6_9ACAR